MNEVNEAVNPFLRVACKNNWKIFPIAGGTKNQPLTAWRRGGPGEVASSDPPQIAQWEFRFPGSNWGVATGAESGIFVLDVDGFEAWLWFAGKGGVDPDNPTYTVLSGNGDPYRLHYYFRAPEGMSIKTSASKIAPGVDIRGDGGMVVAAGSRHPSGRLYEVQDDSPIADAPAWLLELVVEKSAPRVAVEVGPLTEGQRQMGLAIFKARLNKYAEVEDGQWNVGLTALTHLAGRLATAGVFTEDEAEALMMECSTVATYYSEEPRVVSSNIASGFASGAASPWDGAEAEAEMLERAGFGEGELPPGASVDPVKRRAEQIAENIRIGEGSDVHMPSEILTLDEMCERFVYLTEMESVQDLKYPRNILPFTAFMKDHSGSKTEREVPGEWGPRNGEPKKKIYPTASLWMDGGERRKKALTLTFRPGAPVLTLDPEGKLAANTWRPIERTASAASCEVFTKHVEYLFGADTPRFLDWLAHIEKEPGVLPHSGWVHVSPSQGTGRNWLASVLTNLWRGFVAPSFDLAGMLHSGFNGRLSHKLLAVVDEIDEGGSDAKWSNSQALKSIITTDTRAINPKYGHQRLEHNACRWLIFSNHESALPLTEADRRFNVVRNDNPPMDAGYYANLYAALKDRQFIESVAWMLKTRDISGFNPGAHAVMNAAKREMIGASKTETDDIIEDLVMTYASDVITSADISMKLNNGQGIKGHHTHALRRAGVKPYGKALHRGGKMVRVSVLRNWAKWEHASLDELRAELQKVVIPEWKG